MVEIEEVPTEEVPDAEQAAVSAADEARLKAEARRRRILEKSNQRMGIVSGEVSQQQARKDEEGLASTNEPSLDADGSEGGGLVGTLQDPEIEGRSEESPAPSTKPSTSSRLAAMRRRRFKKTSEDKNAESEATSAPKKETNESGGAPAIAGDGAIPSSEETVNEGSPVVVEGDDKKAVTEATPDTMADSTASESDEFATKKKYLGVARKRRQMLKEKQQKEGVDSVTESGATRSVGAGSLPSPPKPVKSSKTPIIFHFVTIFLLFIAGIDIGFHVHVPSFVVVNHRLSPQENGIGILKRFSGENSKEQQRELFVKKSEKLPPWKKRRNAKEFDVIEEESEEESASNIDPLFGVDLDKLAEGDTLFLLAARVAVFLHRINLQIFYYGPKSFLTALLGIPQKLLTTPPLVALLALCIRLFAKHVLGASLPTAPEETGKEDVLAMLKNGVMNFFKNSFPTVVGFYEMFTNLRADMYTILCGIFVGLALSHSFVAINEESATPRDEL